MIKEKDRLEKLYAGYTALKDTSDEKDATIDVLERQMIDKEIEMEGLQELLSDKDNRIRDLELDGAKNSQRVKHLEPELEKMEEMYTREQARLGRVFDVAEELDEALQTATEWLIRSRTKTIGQMGTGKYFQMLSWCLLELLPKNWPF